MLELRGPCVGFRTETFTYKDGRPGSTNLLYVATESGEPTVCIVRDEDLRELGAVGALTLQSFGTMVSIWVEVTERWSNGSKVGCLRSVAAPAVLSDVSGEVPARAAD